MCIGKVQTRFTMSGREERAFGLDHNLHASFFEVKTSGAGGERLIDDIGEGFGDLNSIFCPLSGEEMDGMCYVTVGTLSRLGIILPIGNVALRVLILGSK